MAVLEDFVYTNPFYKSAYDELVKIEHLFHDLPMFLLDTACSLDLVLQKLASNHSTENCIGSIIYLCRQPNLSKPVNIEEIFTYRLILDQLERIRSEYLLSSLTVGDMPFSAQDIVIQSTHHKWVGWNAKALRERLAVMFDRELKKFPITFIDQYQSAKAKMQHDSPGANGQWWVYLKEYNTSMESFSAVNALQMIASSFQSQLARIENKLTIPELKPSTASQAPLTLPVPDITEINTYFTILYKATDPDTAQSPTACRQVKPGHEEDLKLLYNERLREWLKSPDAQERDFLNKEIVKIEGWGNQVEEHFETVEKYHPDFEYRHTLKRYLEYLLKKLDAPEAGSKAKEWKGTENQRKLLFIELAGLGWIEKKEGNLIKFLQNETLPWCEEVTNLIYLLDQLKSSEVQLLRSNLSLQGFISQNFVGADSKSISNVRQGKVNYKKNKSGKPENGDTIDYIISRVLKA